MIFFNKLMAVTDNWKLIFFFWIYLFIQNQVIGFPQIISIWLLRDLWDFFVSSIWNQALHWPLRFSLAERTVSFLSVPRRSLESNHLTVMTLLFCPQSEVASPSSSLMPSQEGTAQALASSGKSVNLQYTQKETLPEPVCGSALGGYLYIQLETLMKINSFIRGILC